MQHCSVAVCAPDNITKKPVFKSMLLSVTSLQGALPHRTPAGGNIQSGVKPNEDPTMTPRQTFCALLLTLPLLAISGCDNMSVPAGQTTQRDDTNLKQTVSEALQRDALFAQSDISVTSQKGNITLNGTVVSIQNKNRAGEIAKQINGVKAVNNNLEIVTSTSSN